MVERCRHQIYSFAYYSLGSRDEAEDATQEVLIRLWEHWQEIDHSSAMAWIIRVTRNACLDLHRKRQNRNALMAVHGEACLVQESSAGTNPEVDYERKDFRARVERALTEIDEPYRTIVILREIEDHSYAEISGAMEMPLNTVKVYLHRGRRMLRERMRHAGAAEASISRAARAWNAAGNSPHCHSESASADEESAVSDWRAPQERNQIPRPPRRTRNDSGMGIGAGIKARVKSFGSRDADPARAN